VLATLSAEKVTLNQVKKLHGRARRCALPGARCLRRSPLKKLSEDLLTLTLRHTRLLEDHAAEEIDLKLPCWPGRSPAPARRADDHQHAVPGRPAGGFWLNSRRGRSMVQQASDADRLQAVFSSMKPTCITGVVNPPRRRRWKTCCGGARSREIGLMLATQSPGDLDYKCRDQIEHG